MKYNMDPVVDLGREKGHKWENGKILMKSVV